MPRVGLGYVVIDVLGIPMVSYSLVFKLTSYAYIFYRIRKVDGEILCVIRHYV